MGWLSFIWYQRIESTSWNLYLIEVLHLTISISKISTISRQSDFNSASWKSWSVWRSFNPSGLNLHVARSSFCYIPALISLFDDLPYKSRTMHVTSAPASENLIPSDRDLERDRSFSSLRPAYILRASFNSVRPQVILTLCIIHSKSGIGRQLAYSVFSVAAVEEGKSNKTFVIRPPTFSILTSHILLRPLIRGLSCNFEK